MAAVAGQNGIKAVFALILPTSSYPWTTGIQPIPVIREVNQWLKQYCASERLV